MIESKLKVLIVEDDTSTLELLNIMINKIGNYDIVSCKSAIEAIDYMSDWTPDIIFSDFMMDNGDGIDLYHYIRTNYINEIPFIFVTCVDIGILRTFLLNEKIINVISKPLVFSNIKNIFNKFHTYDKVA